MKVSIAVITSQYKDGFVDVLTKPFTTFEKAAKHLTDRYHEEKKNLSEIVADEVKEVEGGDYESFFLMTENNEWVRGEIYTQTID